MGHVSSWALTVTAYTSALVALIALEVTARVRPGSVPTLGGVLTWALRRRSTQLGLVLLWWWLGWHFTTNR